MNLCGHGSEMKAVEYLIGINQGDGDNGRLRFQRNLKTSRLKSADIVLIIKFITALGKENIAFSLFYLPRHLIDYSDRLAHIFLVQPLSLNQIHEFPHKNSIGLRPVHNE